MSLRLTLSGLLLGSTITLSVQAGTSREIVRTDSASPDAPVTNLAFGPRARGSIGIDLAFAMRQRETNGWRLGVSGLVAAEDVSGRSLFPGQSLRTNLEMGMAFAYSESALALKFDRRTFEWGFGIGRATAALLAGNYLTDTHRSSDVPFGAGGWYLEVDAATRLPLGARWNFTSRIGLRLFTNWFPNVVGASVASDHIADQLREGGEWQATYEVGTRWQAFSLAQPLARLYLDVIQPHDDSATHRWLGRLLLGVAFPGTQLEMTPYFDVEAGHGSGILMNRSELRFGAGVRLYAL